MTSFAAVHSTDFNETDEEREMHDRVWRFLRPQHGGGRLAGGKSDVGDYYRGLQRTDFRSSRTRFAALGGDIQSDIDMIPAAFETICEVREIDRRRAVALDGLGGLDPATAEGVAKRRAVNEAEIASFTSALGFRFDSYAYALDHLLVEAPHEEARDADGRLNELALLVEEAENNAFCGSGVTIGPPLELEPQVPMLPQTSSDNAAS